jgi:hypothetical protein
MWFNSDAMSGRARADRRCRADTAYHEQDLMCRLIREEADQWVIRRFLRLPAISEGEGDPLKMMALRLNVWLAEESPDQRLSWQV